MSIPIFFSLFFIHTFIFEVVCIIELVCFVFFIIILDDIPSEAI